MVICRIGSLEKIFQRWTRRFHRYLPHRLFRKATWISRFPGTCYLPHRQFRNAYAIEQLQYLRYLPHRQFRKDLERQTVIGWCYLPHRQFRKLGNYRRRSPNGYLPHRQFRKLKLCKKWAKRIIRLRTLEENGGSIGLCAWCRSKLPKDGKQKDTATSSSNKYHPPLDTVGNV